MNDNLTYSLAIALFKSAKKEGLDNLLKIKEELDNIYDIFSSETELLLFFNHPSIHFDNKVKLLDKLTKNVLLLNLLRILIRFKRLKSLPDIINQLTLLTKIETKQFDADLKIPFDIDKNTEEKIKKAIESYTGDKINMNVTIDESIIGGVYIKIGNLVIDNTINNELLKLKERIKRK